MVPEIKHSTFPSKLLGALAALTFYIVLSYCYFGSHQDYARAFIGSGGDPMTYIWGLNWWAWSISHGVNPLVTDFVWYPAGYHLAWGDLVPGVAILMLPVTLLCSAAVSYNIAMLLAPALAAWGGFLLVRYFTHDTIAALVAGYLFGFSSYELGHMLGHLSLVLTFPVPLAILLTFKRFAGEISRSGFVIGFFALSLLLFSFSMEIYATACFFGAIAWLVVLGLMAKTHRQKLLLIAGEVLLASGLMVIAVAPWLWSLLDGASDVPDVINLPGVYSADLLNYVVPTPLTKVGSDLFAGVSSRFFGNQNIAEQTAYLGLPLILIQVLWFRDMLRTRTAKILCVILLLLLLCSLGTTLGAYGVHTRLRGPWTVFDHVPLIRQALPVRLSLYVALITSVIAGFWLAGSSSRRGRMARVAAGLLACVVVLPNQSRFVWSPLPLIEFFNPRSIASTLGPMPNLLVLPAEDADALAMVWQLQSNMTFKQTGGYLGNRPHEFYSWPLSYAIDTGVVGSDFARDVAVFCAGHRVSAIVAGPGTRQSLIDALGRLPWRHDQIDGVYVTYVPSLTSYPYYHISGDYVFDPGFEEWSWIGENVRISAHHREFLLRVTGAYRPPGTGAATMTVGIGNETRTYVLGSGDPLALRLPADTSITISSKSVFVPDNYYHNGDMRRFTVAFNLQDVPSE